MVLAALTVFHDEAAFEYEEEFVFMRMLVPDEFTGKLDELDVLAKSFDSERALRVFVAVDRAHEALDRNVSPKVVADWLALQL